MGQDEEATVRTIEAYREVLTTFIQQHDGIVLDSPGDNLLAEFASVADAVKCAAVVQKEIETRNNELSEDRKMRFGEVASGRWEDALPFMEKALEFSIIGDLPKSTLSINYAQVGRIEEARAMLDDRIKKWPDSMKNVRWFMTNFTQKDLQVLERIAESLSKAGMPGDPSKFYKISAENRLTENEIRKLFFGRKVVGSYMITGKQWSIERSKDGKATVRDGKESDTGKSWIEEDMLCDQWNSLYESLRDCWVVFRNPEGTSENSDEYLGAPGYGIYPFSLVE
jgi:hypothetical protein